MAWIREAVGLLNGKANGRSVKLEKERIKGSGVRSSRNGETVEAAHTVEKRYKRHIVLLGGRVGRVARSNAAQESPVGHVGFRFRQTNHVASRFIVESVL